MLLKYDSQGNQLWNSTWGRDFRDSGYGVLVAPSGGIYVAGQTEINASGRTTAFLLKYSDSPSSPHLFVQSGNKSVSLSWDPPVDEGIGPIKSYSIYRNESKYAMVTGVKFTDKNVTNGMGYKYVIAAVDSSGAEGERSNEVEATPGSVPFPPRNLTGEIVGDDILLKWEPPFDNGGFNVTGFMIYRGNDSHQMEFVASIGYRLNWTDANVARGTQYYYQVAAMNYFGISNLSHENLVFVAKPSDVVIQDMSILGLALVVVFAVVLLLIFAVKKSKGKKARKQKSRTISAKKGLRKG
jgi:hypothetical protein